MEVETIKRTYDEIYYQIVERNSVPDNLFEYNLDMIKRWDHAAYLVFMDKDHQDYQLRAYLSKETQDRIREMLRQLKGMSSNSQSLLGKRRASGTENVNVKVLKETFEQKPSTSNKVLIRPDSASSSDSEETVVNPFAKTKPKTSVVPHTAANRADRTGTNTQQSIPVEPVVPSTPGQPPKQQSKKKKTALNLPFVKYTNEDFEVNKDVNITEIINQLSEMQELDSLVNLEITESDASSDTTAVKTICQRLKQTFPNSVAALIFYSPFVFPQTKNPYLYRVLAVDKFNAGKDSEFLAKASVLTSNDYEGKNLNIGDLPELPEVIINFVKNYPDLMKQLYTVVVYYMYVMTGFRSTVPTKNRIQKKWEIDVSGKTVTLMEGDTADDRRTSLNLKLDAFDAIVNFMRKKSTDLLPLSKDFYAEVLIPMAPKSKTDTGDADFEKAKVLYMIFFELKDKGPTYIYIRPRISNEDSELTRQRYEETKADYVSFIEDAEKTKSVTVFVKEISGITNFKPSAALQKAWNEVYGV